MSGGFRKESGSKLYCDIMSIIETCKKNKCRYLKVFTVYFPVNGPFIDPFFPLPFLEPISRQADLYKK